MQAMLSSFIVRRRDLCCALASLFLLNFSGCSGSQPKPAVDRVALELDAREAMCRHLMQRQDQSDLPEELALEWRFIEFCDKENADPPQRFFERFNDADPPVAPASLANVDIDQGVTHAVEGGYGILLQVWKTRWLDSKSIEVEAGVYQAGKAGFGATYTLRLEEGRWSVVDEEDAWIS